MLWERKRMLKWEYNPENSLKREFSFWRLMPKEVMCPNHKNRISLP
jgi:hypothetical protein